MPTEGACACTDRSETPRNIVVCIDGTSNKFGRRNTNVVKLYRQIKLDTEKGSEPQQHAYYSSGIGTHAKNLPLLHRVEKVISDSFDMALAWNVEENVKDAYGWLARKYQEGDRIYLFGFSRGAYQVRVLASLIHEVGLIRTPTEKQIEMAFGHYRSIHPHKPETREMATEFKKTYCWRGVRIHFVGVWDTVSSVGLIKGDVFVSTSASVTNASHFRHALALDERRVKFMPEYFREMNAHRHSRLRPDADSDIEEVWFSGCHADVGGVSRLGQPYHAGNISLSWMQQEASKHHLIFKPSDLTWDVEDVRSGRCDSLKFGWMILEIMFPFRHQVSFSGTGKNKLKWHWFRPRRIIPGQGIHPSVWYGDMYRPRATLGSRIRIPTVLEGSFNQAERDKPPETEIPDGTVSTDFTELLAWIHRYAGHELGALLAQSSPDSASVADRADWFKHIEDQADFDKFIAIIAYILVYDFSTKNETEVGQLMDTARQCLQPILTVFEHPDLVRALSLLPHFAKNAILRQEIIVDGGMSSALVRILEFSFKTPNKNTLTLIVDSICHLLQSQEADLRNEMIGQLTSKPAPGKTGGLAILSGMLEANDVNLIVTSLRIIILLAGNQMDDCMREARPRLKCKVQKLAERRNGTIGLMAVAAFEVLREHDESARDLRFCNILAYFGSSLWLDVEGGSKDSALANSNDRPPLAINDTQIDEPIVRKIVAAIGSHDLSRRTTATLIFLKLCRYSGVRAQLFDQAALPKVIRQLRRRDTSLLAAYTLKTCLQYYGMWGSQDFNRDEILNNVAPSIVVMFKKGLFDDSIGLVEGFDIFHQLMEHATLKGVFEDGIFTVLKKRLEVHDHDGIRTSLRCLDILEEKNDSTMNGVPHNLGSTGLVKRLVEHSLDRLKKDPWEIQRKCVHVLSALSQTAAGEEAVRSRVDKVVGLLLPEHYWKEGDERELLETPEKSPALSDTTPTRPVPPSQMLGPSYALYSLSRNESLRNEIRNSKRYTTLKGRYLSGTLVSGPDTPPWRVWTPNKGDVLVMIARMIKAVEEGFSYDGIGSVPETIPVTVQHLSGLGVLLRNSVVRALKFLPGLAIGLIQGTTNKLRRGTTRQGDGVEEYLQAMAQRVHVADPAHLPDSPHPEGYRVSLDILMSTSPINSPTCDQPPVSQSARPENDQEHADKATDGTQVTEHPDQGTQPIARSLSVDTTASRSPSTAFPGNGDEITEVPREPESIASTSRVRFAPSHLEGGLTAMRTSNPSSNPPGPSMSSIAEETHEARTDASHRPSSGSITLKDFTVRDLPTKKYLKMHPRARIKVCIGNRAFVSPTVKIGNGLAGETRWTWDFAQPTPPNDEPIDITIERKSLIGYTCIRHIEPTTVRRIREEYDGHRSALPLLEGPPSRGV